MVVELRKVIFFKCILLTSYSYVATVNQQFSSVSSFFTFNNLLNIYKLSNKTSTRSVWSWRIVGEMEICIEFYSLLCHSSQLVDLSRSEYITIYL